MSMEIKLGDVLKNKENNPKIRYYKSQRYGWVEIHEGDRDWKFGISSQEWMDTLRCGVKSL